MTRTLNLVLTLALLFGVAYLSVAGIQTDDPEDRLTVLMGFVLLAATVGGGLAVGVGLPKITGFLVVGILAGPSVSELIPRGALDELRLIEKFALALIALLAGGELSIGSLRPAAKSIAFTTLAVVGVVWLGVTLAFVPVGLFLPFLDDVGIIGILALAGLMGIWAANSSPDLTVAVIEEVGSKGPLTDVILGVTIVKDVVVIVLFTLMLAVAQPVLGSGGGEGVHLLGLLWEVGGALGVGALLGLIFSLYLAKEGEQPAFATFLFAYVLVLAAELLHFELLLAGVAAGFVIENMFEAGDKMIRGIEKVSVVIFAFFFTVAGASLDLSAIGSFWAAGLILFSVRLGLTYWGASLGTRWAGSSDQIQSLAWRGLMSQGGVTLGLLLVLQEKLPEIGEGMVPLGMAVIIGNILGGPVLLKTALAKVGPGEGGSR